MSRNTVTSIRYPARPARPTQVDLQALLAKPMSAETRRYQGLPPREKIATLFPSATEVNGEWKLGRWNSELTRVPVSIEAMKKSGLYYASGFADRWSGSVFHASNEDVAPPTLHAIVKKGELLGFIAQHGTSADRPWQMVRLFDRRATPNGHVFAWERPT
jgi:hypothetical protein